MDEDFSAVEFVVFRGLMKDIVGTIMQILLSL